MHVGDELGATLVICRAFANFRAGKDGEFKLPKEKLKPGIEDVTVKFHAGKIYEVSMAWKQDGTSFEAQRLMLVQKIWRADENGHGQVSERNWRGMALRGGQLGTQERRHGHGVRRHRQRPSSCFRRFRFEG
jgi:hypothetical protein